MGNRNWDSTIPDYMDDVDFSLLEDETEEERNERLELEQDKAREEQNRFRSIAMVYEKADRIITADPVNVNVERHANGVTAWNDGKTITLNTTELRNLDDRDIVSLNGVNYHEVAHILFTPRSGSEFYKWVNLNEYGRAFNMLEDMRIETLMAAKYPSTRLYLEASALRYVMGDLKINGDIGACFPLMHGRKFVDINIRTEIANDFANRVGKDVTIDIAKTIDEYRFLSFPTDSARAKELIAHYAKVLDLVGNLTPITGGSCQHREGYKNGRPESGKNQQEVADRAKGSEGQDKSLDGLEQGHGANAGDQDDDYKSQSFGKLQDTSADVQEFSDKINDKIDEIVSNKQAQTDAKEFRNAVNKNERLNNKLRVANYANSTPMDKSNVAAYQFSEEMRLLEEEVDPTWEYETPSGKLNINRASLNRDINNIDKLFDRWHEGADVCDIEAAILLDHSGSMQGRIHEATNALWVIKRGLENIEARVTAYSFNSASKLLYSADEKAEPNVVRSLEARSGTNPVRALAETEAIMEASNRATKIVFIITDGEWDGNEHSNAAIARMNDEGVLTVIVYIGDLQAYGDSDWARDRIARLSHGAQVFRSVAKASDLVSVAQAIVTSHLQSKIYK